MTPFTQRSGSQTLRNEAAPGAAGVVVVGFGVSLYELVVGGADALEGLGQ